jgi:hypothetical protein
VFALCVLAPSQNVALDTHDPKASHLRLSFLKKRSKITEIVAAEVRRHRAHYLVCLACRDRALRGCWAHR